MEIVKPKISVIIITYNQQHIISRAIESVLPEKELIHEIIICDDCSTDNNWGVILEYQSRFPFLIKPFRNEKNLGIFKNFESTWSKPTGDLIIFISGDDAIIPGLFKKIHDFVQTENIPFQTGSFSIFTDSKAINPEGIESIRSNKLILKGNNSLSLKIRGLVGSLRGVFHSREIISRLKPISKNIGIFTDGLYDTQFHILAENSFYIDFVGGIYYSGIGVASKSILQESLLSKINLYDELSRISVLSERDRNYCKFQKKYNEFIVKPNIMKYLQIWYLYIMSLNFSYGLSYFNDFKSVVKLLSRFYSV